MAETRDEARRWLEEVLAKDSHNPRALRRLAILDGRPGQGKSAFCLSAGYNDSHLHYRHVAVFSLEMSNERWFSA